MKKKIRLRFKWCILFLLVLAEFCLIIPQGAAQIIDSFPPAGNGAGEETEIKYIALTFDDGPRRNTTSKLLDGLKERGAHGTFFLIGRQIKDNEDLVLRMEAEGHQVGIHTYDHTILTNLCRRDFNQQVEKTREILQGLLNHSDYPLRPPYGFLDQNVLKWAQSPIVLWSVDPADWGNKDIERIACCITQKAKDGDIVLMHDFYASSVDAALKAIDTMQEEGAVFVTVKELFSLCGCDLENGTVYHCGGKAASGVQTSAEITRSAEICRK